MRLREGAFSLILNFSTSGAIVHCYAGQNRSAAIVSAYAINKRGWSPNCIKDYLRRQVKKQRNVTAVLQNKAFRHILGM